MTDLHEVPDFLTITEAAALLRLGRTHAYELARVYRTTRGREGLPVIALGRRLLVPRAALERLIETAMSTSAPPSSR